MVFPESLYSYGPVDGPMTEDLPRAATDGKLGVRTELLAQREASATPTVSVAASDFYGPLVRSRTRASALVPTVLAGRTMRVVGSPDQPHSFTYVPDLAAAMIAAAARPGAVELVPPRAHRARAHPARLVELVAGRGRRARPEDVGAPGCRCSARVGTGLARHARAGRDGYMFARPFVMDSSASEQRLGLAPTPLADGVARTVALVARPAGGPPDG